LKLIFFNRFFYPDSSATSQILSDLAFRLAASGHEVHVVTTRAPGAADADETIRGVHIHRVTEASNAATTLPRKGIAYLRYYTGARKAARRLIRAGDTVVLKTDPPLLSRAIGNIAKCQGARVVVWLQDLFPEIAREYGIRGLGGPTGAIVRKLRDDSLAQADSVVAIADLMAGRVASLGCVARDRLTIIHNWADGRAIFPIEPSANPVRKEWQVDEVFVVGYSGNLGRVHEFETLLDAAAILRGHHDIRFLVIGRGPRLSEVSEQASRRDLRNVEFLPHQDRADLAHTLSVPDVHVSILRPEFEGLVQPSKLYGIMAAGRPTIFVGDRDGETARILARAHAGVSISTGDAKGLAAAILDLRDDASKRRQMGENARKEFDEKYDMPIALAQWERLLTST
jgi:glycosyltransferase involved in cell wall biosynthesis